MSDLKLNILTSVSAERLEKILITPPISMVKRGGKKRQDEGVNRFVHPDTIWHRAFIAENRLSDAAKYLLRDDMVTLSDASICREFGDGEVDSKIWKIGYCLDEKFSGETPYSYVVARPDLRLIEYEIGGYKPPIGIEINKFQELWRKRETKRRRFKFAQSLIERFALSEIPFFALEGDHRFKGYRLLCENNIEGGGYYSYAENRQNRRLIPSRV